MHPLLRIPEILSGSKCVKNAFFRFSFPALHLSLPVFMHFMEIINACGLTDCKDKWLKLN